MIRLETLIEAQISQLELFELKFLDSSFPPVEIRKVVPPQVVLLFKVI